MGTAIMKQCENFAKAGVIVELVVPSRHNIHREDPFLYHNVAKSFSIRYLWSLDMPFLGTFHLRFFIQKVTFFMSLCIAVWKSDADVVYTREPELIGFLYTDKKKIVELHHLYGLRFFGRFFLKSCAGIITITHALKEDVIERFGIHTSQVLVAPSGVDIAQFTNVKSREEARKALGITTEKPVALYIGALEEWKGYRIFLEASKMLHNKVQCVVMGGSDTHVATLRAEYPEVIFLGFLPQRDIPHNQQIANVLVVPNSAKEVISARHTSPLKVFAHMTSGIPIVASSVPSIKEILSPANAVLVSPDDPSALAEGIMHALEDILHTIADQAKRDVSQYDWSLRTTSILSFLGR
jgi:glycosyltransferase involved in cell wall biosynthesis